MLWQWAAAAPAGPPSRTSAAANRTRAARPAADAEPAPRRCLLLPCTLLLLVVRPSPTIPTGGVATGRGDAVVTAVRGSAAAGGDGPRGVRDPLRPGAGEQPRRDARDLEREH